MATSSRKDVLSTWQAVPENKWHPAGLLLCDNTKRRGQKTALKSKKRDLWENRETN